LQYTSGSPHKYKNLIIYIKYIENYNINKYIKKSKIKSKYIIYNKNFKIKLIYYLIKYKNRKNYNYL